MGARFHVTRETLAWLAVLAVVVTVMAVAVVGMEVGGGDVEDAASDPTFGTPPPTPGLGPTPKPGRPMDRQNCSKLWGNVFGANQTVGPAMTNIKATYHTYSPHYDLGTLACSDKLRSMPGMASRLVYQYPWTAYCLKSTKKHPGLAPFSQGVCGKCFRVTNRGTRASVIVRAVDQGGCSDDDGTGLDLDPCAFNAIDTDGKGYAAGNMRVDVQEVQC